MKRKRSDNELRHITLKAQKNITHPSRCLFIGRSRSGKTTLAVDIINDYYRGQVDRLIVVCPSWYDQPMFEPLRDMVRSTGDIYITLDKDPFKEIERRLDREKQISDKSGLPRPKSLLFVDDLAGNKFFHSRLGSFSNLSVRSSHLNLSIFSISQQPKFICTALRQNAENVICFPPSSMAGREWLYEEFNGNGIDKETFFAICASAFKGIDPSGNVHTNNQEFGTHFLYIYVEPRRPTRYYADFEWELTPLEFRIKKKQKVNEDND